MQNNILEYLERTVVRLPDKVAFSDGTYDMTFGELSASARSIGTYLLDHGHGRGCVAVLMDKHPVQLAAFFGVLYAGGFYVAPDASMPPKRLQMIMDTVQPCMIICDKKNTALAQTLGLPTALYDDICAYPARDALLEAVRKAHIDTDPAYVVFTSGSTGVPKGVAACHRSVIDYTETLCRAVGFDEHTVFGNQTPLYFDAPLKEIMPTIKYGATAYLIPKQLFMFPVKLCDYLNEHKINTVCWVVSALTMISSLGVLEKNPPKYLSTVCFGSEVFPKNQYEMWRNALPNAKFFNLYGPTEATGMSCYWAAERVLEADEPIPVGRPFDNTRILLINEQGKRAEQGEVGEIYISGTCVTLGYYNNPEKTAEAFVQNPLQSAYPEIVYRTGDLGRYNDHGELVFVSRKDSQIKHMGHRIELGEIEAAAATVQGVHRVCCVYPAQHKKIVMYYVGDVEPAALSKELRLLLPRYMLPTALHQLDTMPLTDNGKLNRRLLLEQATQNDQ